MNDIIESKDPEGLRIAFEALRPMMDALVEIRRANTNMPKAINFAASVGRLVLLPERRAAFVSLPASYFDIQHVDRLGPAALAASYAWLQSQDADAMSTGAQLPPPSVVEAMVLRGVMLKVLEYNLGHHENVLKRLASIRSGHGHMDLASDLWRLAGMYEIHAAELAADTRFYQPGDMIRARQFVQGIQHVLGEGAESDAGFWADYLARAWTLMVNTYEEVSAAGRWLFRNENVEAMFPSLYAIGRQRRRRRADDELPGDGQEQPGDGEEIEPAQPAQ
jgi:hypothetical protein